MLPKEFLDRMKEILGEDFDAFLASYDEIPNGGLRTNPLKISADDLKKLLPFELEKVSWCDSGFYYPADARPGKEPFHDAGLFYMQEPSAMLPAALLDAKPGEIILDLCAAPGGKSTQIAGAMNGEGLLVANEPYPARAKVLSQNIERLGVKNAAVVCAYPDKLAERFFEFFDKIMVDAPCSGEGMFRKDPDTIDEWSEDNVKMCASRQWEILQSAYKMLKPGGRLVYSTCTFSKAEDEDIVERLINELGMTCIEQHRIWPHKERGEGHFAALLQKAGELVHTQIGTNINETCKEFEEFANDTFVNPPDGCIFRVRDELYSGATNPSVLTGLQVIRNGVHLGTVKKNRFEPAHAYALASKKEDVKKTYELEESQVISYLKGETVACENTNGWTLVCYKGYPLGWGKVSGGILKNHYPKGLRRM